MQKQKRLSRSRKRSSISKLHFLLSFFLLSTTAFSQSFNAGVKGGISASQVSGDQLAGFHKAGLILGGFVSRPLSKSSWFQIEMLFIQKGSKKNPNPEKGDYALYKMQLDYLEVPLMFMIKKDKIIYEGGVSIGALVHSNVGNEYGTYPPGSFEARPFNRAEVSGNIGITYALSEQWNANWRLSNSILPIRNHIGNLVYRLNRGQYNTAMEFTLNYIFLKKTATQ